MFTLFVGVLIVVLSALGFGYALFGRRPLPQPATGSALGVLPEDLPESIPSRSALGLNDGREMQNTVPMTAGGRRTRDVTITPAVRARSTLLLALGVVGLAAILGVILSVIVVGVVFLVT